MQTIKNIRLLGIDLDGTLLDEKGVLPAQTSAYLRALQQQGVRIALCSGRSFFEMEAFAHQLALDLYDGYLIGANGAFLYECRQRQMTMKEPLSQTQTRSLIASARRHHLLIYAPVGERYLLEAGGITAMFAHRVKRWRRILPQHWQRALDTFALTSDLSKALSQGAMKLCFRASPLQIKAMRKELARQKEQFYICQLSKSCLEINRYGVDKGTALMTVCEHLAIAPAQVIVFGDSANDHALFARFPHSVAMKNADAQTKGLAAYQTLSNRAQGVCHYLQKLAEHSLQEECHPQTKQEEADV